jgi:hypothetical protein
MQAGRLGESLGLDVPNEWWPSPAMLKSFEAAGFGRVQVHAPPAGMLANLGQSRSAHATEYIDQPRHLAR